ncbi:MAG TPA: YihY/virulence factor BrkB family protein [Acidobacteriota bacterium]|nr:YihY/virulence factor BrkB family protein [Acidobacteriota bacterium]
MRLDLDAFRYWLQGKFWADLWNEINEDNCWGMAAQLSYYFLLAFFPFLLFLSALISFIPVDPDLLNKILSELSNFLPTSTYLLIEEIVTELVGSQDQGVLTLGIMMALWSASLAFNGMVSLFNNAYEVRDNRSYFHVRGLSILVTLIFSTFVLSSGILLFFGDWLIGFITTSPVVKMAYTALRWGLIFLALNIAIQIVYFALPARRLPWRTLSPGSVFATVGGIIGSLGFSYYVNHFGDYQKLYGGLGALIVLMVWFYICSLFLVIGGEMDSEIYRFRRRERGEISREEASKEPDPLESLSPPLRSHKS